MQGFIKQLVYYDIDIIDSQMVAKLIPADAPDKLHKIATVSLLLNSGINYDL